MVRRSLLGLAAALAIGSVAGDALAQERKRPDEEAQKLSRVVEGLRGLKFKHDVVVGLKNREELRAKLVADFQKEFPPEKSALFSKSLFALGLVPKGTDIGKVMLEVLSEQIGGFYDPEAKELFLIEEWTGKEEGDEEKAADPTQDAMKAMMGGAMDMNRIITVHELTHALQDQHFNLLTLPMADETNDDLVTAVKSLVEGEASYVMYDDLFAKMGVPIDKMPMDVSKLMEQGGGMGGPGSEQIAKAPLVIREGLIFPYMKGFSFILKVKKAGGWERVGKMFADLPSSTEQILHPEKYLGPDKDYPVLIELPEEIKEAVGKDWTLLTANRMGELNVNILFRTLFTNTSRAQIDQVSAGWDGDQYGVFENKGKLALVWLSTWDTEKDAVDFISAYNKLIGKKFDNAEPQESKKGELYRFGVDGGRVLLERRGKDVLVIEGFAEKTLETVRTLSWEKTTRTELTEVKRVAPKAETPAAAAPKEGSKTGQGKKVAKTEKTEKGDQGDAAGTAKTAAPAAGAGVPVTWKTAGATLTWTLPQPCCDYKAGEEFAEITCSDVASVARFYAFPKGDDLTMEKAVGEARRRLKTGMKDFALVRQGPTGPYGGMKGVELLCSGTPGEMGEECCLRAVVLDGKKHVFLLIHTVTKADQGVCTNGVESILKSLQVSE